MSLSGAWQLWSRISPAVRDSLPTNRPHPPRSVLQGQKALAAPGFPSPLCTRGSGTHTERESVSPGAGTLLPFHTGHVPAHPVCGSIQRRGVDRDFPQSSDSGGTHLVSQQPGDLFPSSVSVGAQELKGAAFRSSSQISRQAVELTSIRVTRRVHQEGLLLLWEYGTTETRDLEKSQLSVDLCRRGSSRNTLCLLVGTQGARSGAGRG